MTRHALAAALVITFAAASQASQLPDFPFVFARGSARLDVVPDIGTLTFRVYARRADPAKATAVVQERSQQLLKSFSERKIAQKDIVAHEIDKNVVREREKEEPKVVGYEVARRFSVTLRDLKNCEPLVKALLAMEDVIDVSATFDRTDRKKIEAELTAKAGQDAREEAERLARGLGAQLGSVFAISESGFAGLGEEFGMGEAYRESFSNDAFPYKILFVPATISLEKKVTAIFKLKIDGR